MEYIVLGKDGKEYGPVDGETLQKWVEHSRVFKDTKIRNALMMKWNDAGKLDFLQPAFELQEVHEEEESSSVGGKLKNLLGLAPEKHELKEEVQINTAYKQKYMPNPPGPMKRVGAFLIDAAIIALYGLILFFIMVIITGTWVSVDSQGFEKIAAMSEKTGIKEGTTADSGEVIEIIDEEGLEKKAKEASIEKAAPKKEVVEEEEPAEVVAPLVFPPPASLRKSFNFFFAIFSLSIFLYYGISLGIYAQTAGMWYWGLIIVKGHNEEALPTRTFAYAIAAFIMGITTPIVVLVNPQRRSLQGYITGCRLISITAKSKT